MQYKKRNYYQRLLRSPKYEKERIEKANLIVEILKKRVKVTGIGIDIGSGTGIIKNYLSGCFQIPVYGIEIDPEMVRVKRDLIISDACFLPIKNDIVNLIICNHVYEHVHSPSKLLKEMSRILNKGGVIYFTVGNKFQITEPHYKLPFLSWLPLTLANLYLKITGRGNDYSDINFPTYGKLIREIRKANLKFFDITDDVLSSFGKKIKKRGLKWAYSIIRRIPQKVRKKILRHFSPQWFFLFIYEDSHI